jgi:Domain of unknown function (DUF4189)/Bacterial TSP3 repeat
MRGSANIKEKSMTINQPATLMLATGAMVIGAFGVAAPAQAADAYVALSYSLESQKSGMAVAATEDAAKTESLNNCVANGGNHCTPYVIAQNSCAALAIGTDPTLHQEWSTATNSILEMARKQALTKNGGGIIGASGCTTNLVVDPPPQSPDTGQADPAPPAEPQSVPDDHDNDGLSKHDELFDSHTNPFLADTDFDGVNDGDEVTNGTNPLNPHSP